MNIKCIIIITLFVICSNILNAKDTDEGFEITYTVISEDKTDHQNSGKTLVEISNLMLEKAADIKLSIFDPTSLNPSPIPPIAIGDLFPGDIKGIKSNLHIDPHVIWKVEYINETGNNVIMYIDNEKNVVYMDYFLTLMKSSKSNSPDCKISSNASTT